MKKRRRKGWPRLTALQFYVLGVLLDGAKTVLEVRAKLTERKQWIDRGALYRLMARLARDGWVEREPMPAGSILRQRDYRVTIKGLIAWQRTRRFYLDLRPAGAMLKPSGQSKRVAEERLMELAEKMDQQRKDRKFRAQLEKGLLRIVKAYANSSQEEWQKAVERVMRAKERGEV